jgi:phosphatidylinositol alpha-1,6-mannosyltransferase
VRRRLGIPEDAPVVVCTARMIKRKGQDTLVRAWPEVLRSHPDARLLLVGDGPNRKAVERLARRQRVTDSVIFTGSVPWSEVPGYTDAGDVVAMPCRTRLFGLEPEAFGIVFLEAQACGHRVVAGGSGGSSEAIVDERSVVLPPRASIAQIASSLIGAFSRRERAVTPRLSALSWDALTATLGQLLRVSATAKSSWSLGMPPPRWLCRSCYTSPEPRRPA